jgi:acetolactate synthase-1/2/3 large subunit
MAQRVPQGPVYISMSLEAMFAEWQKPEVLRRIPPAPKLQPLSADVEAVAALVRTAKKPVIVTEGPGRDPDACLALVALADAIAAPVIGARGNPYTAFPKSHPMWLGYGDFEPLKSADLILLVGGKAPWYPPSQRPGPGEIVVIGENPLKSTLAYQNLQADHYLEGDTASSLRLLVAALGSEPGDKAAIETRRAQWTKAHDALVASLGAAMDKARKADTLDAVGLAAIAGDMLPKTTIYLDETITHMPVMRPYLPLDEPQSFFRLGNGALGQGIGNALGVKLAKKDRPVVLFIGDGTFLYNPIVQALGASKTYDLPILIVVCNNAKYEAMRKGHERFYPGGAAEAMKWKYGVEIPGFDYENLGSHFGFAGARAETPAELRKAFETGLAALKDGRSAILNVVLTK